MFFFLLNRDLNVHNVSDNFSFVQLAFLKLEHQISYKCSSTFRFHIKPAIITMHGLHSLVRFGD